MSFGALLALAAGALWLASCRPTAQDARVAPGAAASAQASGVSALPAAVTAKPPDGASASSAPAQAPAPPTPSAAAIIRSATAVEPSGRTALAAGVDTVVDPAATFEIDLSGRSADARLVLLDGRDALVAATSAREVGPASTRLTLAPAAPLSPGSRYVLRVDGAATRELHDAGGRAYEPVAHPLLVAGTPPPPEPKKPPKRRRR